MKSCVIGRIVRPHSEYDLFQRLTVIDCITVCNMYACAPDMTR